MTSTEPLEALQPDNLAGNAPTPNSRGEILEAAKRVIAQKGIIGASMRAIALEAGVTTGAIVHHFKDKSELLHETLQSVFEPWFEILNSARALADPWEQLQYIFLASRPEDDHRQARTQIWLALLVQIEREERLGKAYRDNNKVISDTVYAIFREGQKQGILRPELDPRTECDHLIALGDGLVVSSLAEPDRFRPDFVKSVMLHQLQSLRVRPA